MPLVLAVLETDAIASELYDGELLASLKCVPLEFWSQNQNEKGRLVRLLKTASLPDDLRQDVEELLSRLSK